MARIDRAWLDAVHLPVSVEIATRFDDLDVLGHVNNAAIVVLLQEARVQFNRAAGLPELPHGLRTMVAALNVDYVAELHHPAPVRIDMGLLAIGRTSFTIAQRIRQDERAAVYAQTILVLADADGPVPLSASLRADFASLVVERMPVA